MAQQGGDRAFAMGDAITVENAEGSTITPGDWVAITGHTGDHPQVALSDAADGNDLVGVVKADAGEADDGELLAVQLRGAVWARVESGVTAGDELAPTDSGATSPAGPAGAATSGGSTGLYAMDDAQQLADDEYYAPIHLD